MNETCDRCGPEVRAIYRVDRDAELYLCRHCANQLRRRCSRKAGASGLLASASSHRKAA